MFSLSRGKYTGEITKSKNIDSIILSTTQYLVEESNYDWHYHENPHISFVFQGEDSEGRRRVNNKNISGISFYFAGEKHRWVSRHPVSKSANIEIGNKFIDKYNFQESCIDKAVRLNIEAKFLMLKIQQELLLNDKNSSTAIQTLLLELLSHTKKVNSPTVPKWVLVLNDLLNDRWNENLTLKELASVTNVHPTTISKHFRRYFSCTYGEYSRKLKIDKSITLIKNSNLTLTNIAFQCGFADQSHFTRTFKHITGFLPKDFRNI